MDYLLMRPFYKAMVMAIALFTLPVTGASAKNKPARNQTYCLAEIMENEGRPTTEGRVSVGLVVLTRAVSGLWGPKNDVCALRKPNEFNYLYKKVRSPTTATMAVASQMMRDRENGKPTIEVALQQQLAGSQYFHNPSAWPGWSKTYEQKGFVGNHYIYYNPKQGFVSVYK